MGGWSQDWSRSLAPNGAALVLKNKPSPFGVLFVKSAGFRKNITLIKMQNKMDFIIFIKRYFLHIAICMHAYNITLL